MHAVYESCYLNSNFGWNLAKISVMTESWNIYEDWISISQFLSKTALFFKYLNNFWSKHIYCDFISWVYSIINTSMLMYLKRLKWHIELYWFNFNILFSSGENENLVIYIQIWNWKLNHQIWTFGWFTKWEE
jgi:hypothetical protein